MSPSVSRTWPATIASVERLSDQARASAIWPTAAAAWLSSSLSAPAGTLSTVRPSAIAPDETTSTSTPLALRLATSVHIASSQAFFNPAARSTSNADPILMTTRRYF
ncbi:hypothetical protein D9M72_582660 [compost metagenome]